MKRKTSLTCFGLLGPCLILAGPTSPKGPPELDPTFKPSFVKDYRSWKQATSGRHKVQTINFILCSDHFSRVREKPNNPHRLKYIKVYVNGKGRTRMLSSVIGPKFPVGTVIVKEKYASPTAPKPELLTVMRKAGPGESKNPGGWQYWALEPATLSAPKQSIQHCVSCHNDRSSGDYVFRDYVLIPAYRDGKQTLAKPRN